jgi:hypothetical protein
LLSDLGFGGSSFGAAGGFGSVLPGGSAFAGGVPDGGAPGGGVIDGGSLGGGAPWGGGPPIVIAGSSSSQSHLPWSAKVTRKIERRPAPATPPRSTSNVCL